MSGTELRRLMVEVTAQPPLDVDFAAIQHRVQRRQRRRGVTAVAATVIVVVGIAVPAALSSRKGPSTSGASARPSAVSASASTAAIDPSWVAGSWDGFSWRQPARWKLVDAGVGDHSRPMNAGIEGPFLTTEKLGHGCAPISDGFQCGRALVLEHLPVDGVVVELIGSFSEPGPITTPADDTGTVTAPDQICTGWGGAASFTASRSFTAPGGPAVLQLVGCLGAAVPASAATDLRTVLASASYSANPTQAVGTPSALGSPTPIGTPTEPAGTPTPGPVVTSRAKGTTAAQLCHSALGSYVSAELSSVAEIRSATWGPATVDGKGRLAAAFSGAKASDPAAWCWTGNRQVYTDWAVHAGDLPVDAAAIGDSGPGDPPSGPPNFP